MTESVHPVSIYLATLAPGRSREQATRSLRRICELAGGDPDNCWEALRGPGFHEMRDKLAARYAPATVRHMLSCLRGVLKAAEDDLLSRPPPDGHGAMPEAGPGTAVTVAGAGLPGPTRPASPTLAYLASLSVGPSRESGRSALRCLVRIAGFLSGREYGAFEDFPWEQLRAAETMQLRSELAARYAPATANRILSVLRGVLRAAWRLGAMSTDDYQRAIDFRAVPGSRLPAGRSATDEELSRLIASCRDRKNVLLGTRDAAAFALLYSGGLRRAEACSLQLRDVDLDSGEIRVIGKGNRQRRIWLSSGALEALNRWIELRGREPGPVLTQLRRGTRVAGNRGISGDALMRRLARRAQAAGLDRLTPHDLRRTFVSDSLEAGTDIAIVQRLAGHASPLTTARYDRRGDRSLQKASTRIHDPFSDDRAAVRDDG